MNLLGEPLGRRVMQQAIQRHLDEAWHRSLGIVHACIALPTSAMPSIAPSHARSALSTIENDRLAPGSSAAIPRSVIVGTAAIAGTTCIACAPAASKRVRKRTPHLEAHGVNQEVGDGTPLPPRDVALVDIGLSRHAGDLPACRVGARP